MQFAFSALALAATVLAASGSASDAVSYEVETVTKEHTTQVTITSCSEDKCATTVQAVSHTVITETVDGVETVYATICPLTESPSVATPTTVAPVTDNVVPAQPKALEPAVETESDSYVDITTTPTVVVSTGVQSTKYARSTFTSIYNSSTVAAPSVSFVNDAAPRNILAGAVGVVGIAALLL